MQLPIINAPFRLYWAYNFDRLEQQIIAPPSFVPVFVAREHPAIGWRQRFINSQIVPQINSLLINPQRINFFESREHVPLHGESNFLRNCRTTKNEKFREPVNGEDMA